MKSLPESRGDDNIIILNHNFDKITPQNRNKLLDVAKGLFEELELSDVFRPYFSEDEAKSLANAVKSGLPIIINGVQKPTGKTTLCQKLRELGFNVSERWELPKKESDNNAANIVITLNKKVR